MTDVPLNIRSQLCPGNRYREHPCQLEMRWFIKQMTGCLEPRSRVKTRPTQVLRRFFIPDSDCLHEAPRFLKGEEKEIVKDGTWGPDDDGDVLLFDFTAFYGTCDVLFVAENAWCLWRHAKMARISKTPFWEIYDSVIRIGFFLSQFRVQIKQIRSILRKKKEFGIKCKSFWTWPFFARELQVSEVKTFD